MGPEPRPGRGGARGGEAVAARRVHRCSLGGGARAGRSERCPGQCADPDQGNGHRGGSSAASSAGAAAASTRGGTSAASPGPSGPARAAGPGSTTRPAGRGWWLSRLRGRTCAD